MQLNQPIIKTGNKQTALHARPPQHTSAERRALLDQTSGAGLVSEGITP